MNKKIIVPTLAMLMGAGLVGSISGTVAWYQYSTRAIVSMMGASLGVNRNLQVALGDSAPAEDAWKTEIKTADIMTELGRSKIEMNPTTVVGGYVKNAAVTGAFKGNPRKYVPAPANWNAAAETDVVEFNLWVRAYEDTNGSKVLVDKKLGLFDAKISNPSTNTKSDISSAVRVAISNATDDKHIVLAADSASTTLSGQLDLDNDGQPDKEWGYSEEPGVTLNTLTYGEGTGTTYDLATEAATLFCTEGFDTTTNKDTISGGISLGSTHSGVKLNVKIWLEGWQKLEGSALWDVASYVGSTFFVGFTLASGY